MKRGGELQGLFSMANFSWAGRNDLRKGGLRTQKFF